MGESVMKFKLIPAPMNTCTSYFMTFGGESECHYWLHDYLSDLV